MLLESSSPGAHFMLRLPCMVSSYEGLITRADTLELGEFHHTERPDVILLTPPASTLFDLLSHFSRDADVHLLRCTALEQLLQLSQSRWPALLVIDEPEHWRTGETNTPLDDIAHCLKMATSSREMPPLLIHKAGAWQPPDLSTQLPSPPTVEEWKATLLKLL